MKPRQLLKITSRTSSITNSFVQAIIPSIDPTDAEISEALGILGMTQDSLTCVYCGTSATDMDHLRPLVQKRRPTGYLNEIRNLVPACGRCNQSKGGKEWRQWMLGNAKNSPTRRGIQDIQNRISILERYEQWGNVQPLSLDALAGTDVWNSHWANLSQIERQMKEAQAHALVVQKAIRHALGK